jgi:hypothetical protein
MPSLQNVFIGRLITGDSNGSRRGWQGDEQIYIYINAAGSHQLLLPASLFIALSPFTTFASRVRILTVDPGVSH